MESAQPLDDNLKIATLVNGIHGNLQQHLLLRLKHTSTWSQVREIVENYYSCLIGQEARSQRPQRSEARKRSSNYKGKG